MKLKPEKVDDLVRKLVEFLATSENASLLDETKAAAHARQALLEDLQREDTLDKQVRELLKRHANQIHGDNLDYDLLFQRAKRQLAREKGIVL